MHRHCSVTLDFDIDGDGDFEGMTAAEVRDKLVQRFDAMCAYYCGDLLITVSGT